MSAAMPSSVTTPMAAEAVTIQISTVQPTTTATATQPITTAQIILAEPPPPIPKRALNATQAPNPNNLCCDFCYEDPCSSMWNCCAKVCLCCACICDTCAQTARNEARVASGAAAYQYGKEHNNKAIQALGADQMGCGLCYCFCPDKVDAYAQNKISCYTKCYDGCGSLLTGCCKTFASCCSSSCNLVTKCCSESCMPAASKCCSAFGNFAVSSANIAVKCLEGTMNCCLKAICKKR